MNAKDSKEKVAWVSGAIVPAVHALSVADRGFTLGDSVFETVLVKDGVPLFWPQHVSRLMVGLRALKMQVDFDFRDVKAIAKIIKILISRNNLSSDYYAMRVTVSRGCGGRGLQVLPDMIPTIAITLAAYQPIAHGAVHSIVYDEVRRASTKLTTFKHSGSYGVNVLARIAADERGADDAILLNPEGDITGLTAANLFAILPDGTTLTPRIEDGALPGVVRNILVGDLEEVVAAPFNLSLLHDALLFATNCLMGIRKIKIVSDIAGENSCSTAQVSIISRLEAHYERAVICSFDATREGLLG